jgi:hypothetical protein
MAAARSLRAAATGSRKVPRGNRVQTMAACVAIRREGAWDAIRSASPIATRVATSAASRSRLNLNAGLAAVELRMRLAHPVDGSGGGAGCAHGP